MKKILILTILITQAIFSFSQSIFTNTNNKTNYKISGEIIGLQDSTVMLAYYFGGKQYATDTANVINGRFTFEGNKKLKGGMYLVVLSENKYFDLIISEQQFSFSTKLNDLVGSMNFKNSSENPPFYEYLNFIIKMQEEVTPIRKKLESAVGEVKSSLQVKAQEIDKKVKEYRTNFLKNNSRSKKIKWW